MKIRDILSGECPASSLDITRNILVGFGCITFVGVYPFEFSDILLFQNLGSNSDLPWDWQELDVSHCL